jgi:hypothetical protein
MASTPAALRIVRDSEAAAALLDPYSQQLLAELRQPE